MKQTFILSLAVLYATATAADLALQPDLVEPIDTNDAIDQQAEELAIPEPMDSADPED